MIFKLADPFIDSFEREDAVALLVRSETTLKQRLKEKRISSFTISLSLSLHSQFLPSSPLSFAVHHRQHHHHRIGKRQQLGKLLNLCAVVCEERDDRNCYLNQTKTDWLNHGYIDGIKTWIIGRNQKGRERKNERKKEREREREKMENGRKRLKEKERGFRRLDWVKFNSRSFVVWCLL